MKGKVIPVNGTIFKFTHILINAWIKIRLEIQTAISWAKKSGDFEAI